MADKQRYTKQGFQSLIDERQRRITVDREKIREDIAVAKGFGDLSENAEYDAARNAQAENESRIEELQLLIDNAIVEEDTDSDLINLGSEVIVEEDGETETYHIVGSNEVDAFNNLISDQSPIGYAMMGKKAGDTVTIHLANGHTRELRIVSVVRKSHEQSN